MIMPCSTDTSASLARDLSCPAVPTSTPTGNVATATLAVDLKIGLVDELERPQIWPLSRVNAAPEDTMYTPLGRERYIVNND